MPLQGHMACRDSSCYPVAPPFHKVAAVPSGRHVHNLASHAALAAASAWSIGGTSVGVTTPRSATTDASDLSAAVDAVDAPVAVDVRMAVVPPVACASSAAMIKLDFMLGLTPAALATSCSWNRFMARSCASRSSSTSCTGFSRAGVRGSMAGVAARGAAAGVAARGADTATAAGVADTGGEAAAGAGRRMATGAGRGGAAGTGGELATGAGGEAAAGAAGEGGATATTAGVLATTAGGSGSDDAVAGVARGVGFVEGVVAGLATSGTYGALEPAAADGGEGVLVAVLVPVLRDVVQLGASCFASQAALAASAGEGASAAVVDVSDNAVAVGEPAAIGMVAAATVPAAGVELAARGEAAGAVGEGGARASTGGGVGAGVSSFMVRVAAGPAG